MDYRKNNKHEKKNNHWCLYDEYFSLASAGDLYVNKGDLKEALIKYADAANCANEIIKKYAKNDEINDWNEQIFDLSKTLSWLCLEIENPGFKEIVHHLREENYGQLAEIKKCDPNFELKFNLAYDYLKKQNKNY